jgi:outer membrane protein OmpA-like peptidoglycan-associated protein/tetratricopeptide (TPR) repeat protein
MQLNKLIFIGILFLCSTALAQKETKEQRAAAKYFIKALELNASKRYEEAWATMEKSIASDPTVADAYSRLGQWYFEGHEFEKAAETFRKATVKCINGKLRFVKPLTKSLIYAGQGEEALQLINNYATLRDSVEWNFYRKQATFVKSAMLKSWGIWPANLGVRINTADPELFPSMAVDTQFLYFTRRVNNMDEELYSARADSCGGWFSADNIGDPPNTSNQESAQFISADGHYLFLTRCENRSEDGAAEGGCDLFMAYRVKLDTTWTIAQPFGKTINIDTYEGMPSLSPDNRELYFVSNRKGGYGGYDIWISRFEDGLWQLPVNAGPGINTKGDETTPFIAADNKTLFFASNYRPGMGGTDLFVSRRKDEDNWGQAENLGYPINTAYDEKSELVALDGKTLYFASDRNGPAGNYDIYRTQLPGVIAPVPVSYLQGYVFDSISGERLNSAYIIITNAATGDTLYQLRSNRGDASYVITLQTQKTYIVHTIRMSYQEVSDTIVFGKEYLSHPLTHNIAMLRLDYDPVVHINDSLIASVHFDVNITELAPEEKMALQAQISPWLEEKDIIIYINAYTDNTGTPMINEGLSFKRAKIVAQELISSGFNEAMISAKGWGEANPISTNDTEEGRYKNRRVEITVRR